MVRRLPSTDEPPQIFPFCLSVCGESKYILVDQLIKLEKLTSFWTHKDLLQVWHRNTNLQKQMQTKNNCSEFNKLSWSVRPSQSKGSVHLWSRRGYSAQVRVIWWFLLWEMERKTGNSSAVQHGRVPKKTESFLQIQLFPSWYLGSASSQTEGTERDQRWHQGCHRSRAHGTTRLSYAGGAETTALWKSREDWGALCASIDHYKIFSWSAATILRQESRTAPSAMPSIAGGPEMGLRVCSFPEK